MAPLDDLLPELARDLHSVTASGILPSQELRALCDQGAIRAQRPWEEAQFQPASLDLRLGPVGHRVRASLLPGRGARVMDKMAPHVITAVDLTRPAVLERNCVYLIPLLESLELPAPLWGVANPRSTTGRLDIFTRLVADGAEEFDRVPAGYRGPLYVEVVPRTFPAVVREGTRLNQIRFIEGQAQTEDGHLSRLGADEPLVYLDADTPGEAKISGGLLVSINLRETGGSPVVGYRARTNAPAIDLDRAGAYDTREFWDRVEANDAGTLILNPGDFYILASRERVRVPPGHAAEMVAFDPTLGEFRIHYAGFFDPGFGYGAGDVRGTPAVLEVRAHDVPFLMEHGQVVGRLVYSRLKAVPDKVYGVDIGSSYQFQTLALSKQFRRA